MHLIQTTFSVLLLFICFLHSTQSYNIHYENRKSQLYHNQVNRGSQFQYQHETYTLPVNVYREKSNNSTVSSFNENNNIIQRDCGSVNNPRFSCNHVQRWKSNGNYEYGQQREIVTKYFNPIKYKDGNGHGYENQLFVQPIRYIHTFG
jgi:hypothetical protein